jgi:Leucine-rich repeat (LRR) protein
MKISKTGKHQLENNLFYSPNASIKEGRFQKLPDDVEEYENIHISTLAMDFPSGTSNNERKLIENEWINALPKLDNIKSLSIRHRVSSEFFEAICSMNNLEVLRFWTSTVIDLSPLKKLKNLTTLHLDSFSKLEDISPILELKKLNKLSIENCFKIKNYELLGGLNKLEALRLGGDTFAPKNLILSSLYPLTSLSNLKHLDLSSTSIKDKSFLELLKMKNLLRLDASWRMKKEIRIKIKSNLPTLKSGFFMAYDFESQDFYDGIEWWIKQ